MVAQRRAARKAYQRVKKASRPGGGQRFKALVKSISARGKVRNPEGVAAMVGRRKLGKARFQKMAAAGRKRK